MINNALDLEGLEYYDSKLKKHVDSELLNKVDKVSGKVLSTNDYTTAEKTKLAGIATGANNYTHPASGASVGTYKSVTIDENGHVTKGTNPTTLAGYGITDAEAKGAASSAVSAHNISSTSHSDIRSLITTLTTRLNTLADSDDITLDQMSEIVEYIKANKELIDSITTSKVSVSDIVNNLTTNAPTKSLSAAQGVAIKNLIDILQEEVNTKAESSDLTVHAENTDIHITSTERANWNDANSKKHTHSNKTVLDNTTASYTTSLNTKLSGIAAGAEVNQNAFSNIKVGTTTVASDSKTDTLELVGSNVTLTPDATNDKITIGITKTNVTDALGYTPPTTNTTYSDATTLAHGLMSAADKAKLDGITEGADNVSVSQSLTSGTQVGTITVNGTPTNLYAPTNTDTHYTSKNVVGSSTATSNTTTALTNGNVYLNSVENGAVTSTHKISGSGATTVTTDTSGNIVISSTDNDTTYGAAGSSLGLVKTGGDVTISSGVITVNDDSHAHIISNVDGLQSSLDAKVPNTRTVNGKALSANITLSASDVGADVSGSSSIVQANLDAVSDELDGHVSNTNMHTTSSEKTNWNTAYTHSQSTHARTDATKVEKSSTNGNIKINGTETVVYTHPSGTNPHGTTKSDIGLGNVENKSSATIRGEITSSNVTTALGYTPLNSTLKGSGNGVAELDANGKVPTAQLPSYVDDVLEYTTKSNFPATGESGKIYVDATTNLTYRWSGSAYVEISPSLALGETSSTAYRGDRGKIAYDHSQTAHAPSNAEANQNAFSNVKVGTTTIAADTKTDTLELVAGSNVTITPDATNDKITISSTDTKYTHPNSGATAGTYRSVTVNAQGHVTAGSNPTVTVAQGGTGATDAVGARTNLGLGSAATYNTTTTITNGETSLITSGAVYSGLANKLSTSGGSLSGALQLNTVIASHSSPISQCLVINCSAPSSDTTLSLANTPGIGFHISNTSWGSLIFDGAFKFINSSFDGYMPVYASTLYESGTALSSKYAPYSHTHSYAGSSSAGGSATSAVKLDTATAGSATQPVYFSGGKPVATTYTLGASVPSGAKFTDTVYTHPTTSGNKHIPSGGSSGQILRWSADGTAVWGADNNTTYGVVSTTADGLAPKRDGSTTKFLRGDGTWATPPDTNTTYSNMTAATSSTAGKSGLVPAPAAGKQTSFLRGDGTWVVPTNTTYSNFVKSGTGAAAGLVPAPSTTAGTTKYLREDGTWTVPPNTTYSAATTSANGLMSSTDKAKLDAITASADAVSFTSSLTSGTKVGTITINGTGTDLYAPTNTDTHYTTGLKVGASSTATANASATNGNVYLNVLDNTTVRDSHNIVGSGSVTVTSDANGKITITGTDTNTTYSNFVKSGSGAKAGLVPAPSTTAGATKYLREDGTWAVPPDNNTTYTLSSITGTLAVDKGGTGATTASAARTNLGLGSASTYSATSSITSGGTGLITSGAVYTGLADKLSTTGTAAKATSDASGNNIANTYMKKTADCDLDMNDYAITINMGWIQFNDCEAPVYICNNSDNDNNGAFEAWDSNLGENIFSISVEGGTIAGSKILTEANSTAVKIVSSAPSDTSALWVW